MMLNPLKILEKPFVLLAMLLSSTSAFGLGESAQTFTYQGRMMNSTGTYPLSDVIDLTLTLYNPSKNCILYEEVQNNIDLTTTNGMFSVQVGSTPGAGKRSANDPGLSMGLIFQNTKPVRTPGSNCVAGYVPSAGDVRSLRVKVTPHMSGVPNTLSPDQEINSVPQASAAETLQGLSPTDMIQSASGVVGQGNVSLATLTTLTGSTDASSLHHHDSLYVKMGGGGTPTNLGAGAYSSAGMDFSGSNGTQTLDVRRNSVANSSGNDLNILAGGASTGGTNQGGGNLLLSSGISTGTAGSQIVFQTANVGSSGSADNTNSTKMILNSAGRLGVGTLTPNGQLEVAAGSASTIGTIIKGFLSQAADLFQVRDSTNAVLAKIDPNGKIFGKGLDAGALVVSNVANPVVPQDAATKSYVDTQVAAVSGGVASFNTRTGAVTLNSGDVTSALSYTPLKNTTDTLTGNLTVTGNLPVAGVGSFGGAPGASTQFQSTANSATQIGAVIKGAASQSADLLDFLNSAGTVISKVDANGMLTLSANPSAGLHSATKSYVDTAISSVQPAGAYMTSLTSDVTATGPGAAAATVVSVGGSTAANINTATVASNAATALNAASTIVKRDASGNFAAGTISGNLTGSVTGAASLNVLKTGDRMTGQLKLNTAVTADPLAQTLVATGADTNKGQVVQANSATQTANLSEWQTSLGALLAKVDPSGKIFGKGLDASSQSITNVLNPVAAQDAATKNYVDTAIVAAATGVSSFNSRTGAVTLSGADVTSALTFTPLKNTTDTLTGNLTITGNLPVAGIGSFGGAPGANTQLQSTATSATQIGAVVKAAAAQSADLLQVQNSTGTALSKFDSSGFLTLPGLPTTANMAATKAYVDTVIAGSGVTSFNTRTGAVSLTAGDVTTALTYNPLKNTTDTLTGSLTVTATGGFGGAAGAGTQFQSTATSATQISAAIKGAASQSADLLDFLNSTGTVLSKVDSAGMLTLAGAPSTALHAATKSYVDTAIAAAAGPWTVSGADIYRASGNVGIGTTAPAGILDVQSDVVGGTNHINFKIETAASGDPFNLGVNTGSVRRATLSSQQGTWRQAMVLSDTGAVTETMFGLSNSNDSGSTWASALSVLQNGNVGMGTNTPGSQLQVSTTAAASKGFILKGFAGQSGNLLEWQNSAGGVLSIVDSGGFITLPGAPTVALHAATKQYVDSAIMSVPAPWLVNGPNTYRNTGYVGINTAVPAGHFDVQGGTANAATDGVPLKLYAQNAGSGNQNGGNIFLVPGAKTGTGNNGSVLIGTGWLPSSTTPPSSLFVDGTIRTGSGLEIANTNPLKWGSIGTTKISGVSDSTTNDNLIFRVNSTNMVHVTPAGVGIAGISTPSYTLQVNGSIAGTSAYNNLSDARLKTDMKPLEGVMEKLEGLHGITYKWKDPVKMKETREQIGFVAQDVQKVFPQAVTTQNDGFLSVAYSMIIPPTVEAVKMIYTRLMSVETSLHDLKDKVNLNAKKSDLRLASLEKENNELKAKNEKVAAELNQLRTDVASLMQKKNSPRQPASVKKRTGF